MSVVLLVLNCLGVLIGLGLIARATTMTNIALIIYLPALGLELLVLTPLTVVSCCRERSWAKRAVLLLSLVGSVGLASVATFLNADYGAKW